LCFLKFKLSVKVKRFVSLLCVCAILPAKAIPKMTYTVSGSTLNPTHSLTHPLGLGLESWCIGLGLGLGLESWCFGPITGQYIVADANTE